MLYTLLLFLFVQFLTYCGLLFCWIDAGGVLAQCSCVLQCETSCQTVALVFPTYNQEYRGFRVGVIAVPTGLVASALTRTEKDQEK